MTSDEPVDVLGPKTENRAPPSEAHNGDPRVPTRGMIPDPRLRNSQHGRDIVQAKQALTELLMFLIHFFSERSRFQKPCRITP